MPNALEDFSQAVSATVATHAPKVVRIEARRRPSSGFVYSADGLIVAAHHAVERDEDLRVSLDGESTVAAELVGRDPATDVAVLRIAAEGLADPAWGEPAAQAVGNVIVALGRPGRTVRASLGIVGAAAEGWRTQAGQRLDRYLEASLYLPPGFSGGPVLDASGHLAGLATSGLVPRTAMIVPASSLRRIVDEVVKQGGIRRGYLGIGSYPVRLQGRSADAAGVDAGLLVFSVEPGGPADQAGILLGDVLLALDQQPLQSLEALMATLTHERVGKGTAARVLRAGVVQDVSITVGARR